MISIYENEPLARNNRPYGTNTIELRMMLCMAVRDFHYERTQNDKLDFFPYVSEYVTKLIQPKDPKMFKDVLKLELINAEKLSFITPSGELTPRGIMFIELNTRGSYMYLPTRNFDILFNNFMTAMQFGNEAFYFSPDMPDYKNIDKLEEIPQEEEEEGDLHIKAEDFAAFLQTMQKKQIKEAGDKPKTKKRVRKS